MKKTILISISLLLAGFLHAQDTDLDKIIVKRVADYILDDTRLGFVSMDGRQTYSSTRDIPDNVDVRLQSTFGEWHYTNGVLNIAMVIVRTVFVI